MVEVRSEIFGGVDAALEEDGVDGVFEEFGNQLRRA